MFGLHDYVYCLSVCYSSTRRICSAFMIMFIVCLFVTVVPEGYVRPSYNVYCPSVCYSSTRRICSAFMIMFIVYLFVTVVPEGYVRPS